MLRFQRPTSAANEFVTLLERAVGHGNLELELLLGATCHDDAFHVITRLWFVLAQVVRPGHLASYANLSN